MRRLMLTLCGLMIATTLLAGGKRREIPAFIHGCYTVETLMNEAEVANPGYDDFNYIYLMAWPHDWFKLDFDRSLEEVRGYADAFDYTKAEGNLHFVPEVVRQAHAVGTRVLMSFGGQKEFLIFTEKPDRIEKFAAYVVRMVERNDFDGVEIDWEITLDKELHIRMMADIRSLLNELSTRTGKEYHVTTALSIDHIYTKDLARRLAREIDWINIMSYDMCDGIWGSTPSHNTSMKKLKEKIEKWNLLFDRKQLCLGLASYGFYYKGVQPGQRVPDGPLSKYGRYTTHWQMAQRLKEGWTEEFDVEAEVPYYFSPDRNEFVTMENPATILNKIKWVKANGYRGVFWWEFHHDYIRPQQVGERGRHPLMDVVTNYLKLNN